ncbi:MULTISPECIES: maleylpyruvate isomerase family mycothiol-dependent enzyme [unclassified Streptomyces]|uniref:maleylpyruvate isomerase family mycothiol-dependent enzyme n=1 Tax=unclassified Streptomyces TaxID=2593676 RepID=UPI0004C26F80|nr:MULTISPECIES: maleylpyruvate isomerase family mycothiol-dependent enzyme [unclassified Streptomyces]
MDTTRFLETLDHEGRLLGEIAEETGPEAEVPTCPGWQVRDLLAHTGAIHRWATSFVAEAHTSPRPQGEAPDLTGDALLAWYRDGHRRLVDTLAAAPADLRCWTFLPGAAAPVAFWARRQAHETAVHRVDAEAARGAAPAAVAMDPAHGFAPAFAADGIDELLRGFHARSRSRVRTPEPRVLRVRATDVPDAMWTVRLSPAPPVTERGATADADCELAGPAAVLHLALWNRAPVPSVTGDTALAGLWRETSAIG